MPPAATTTRPPILFLAAILLGVEALAAVAFAVVEIGQVSSRRLAVGWGVGLMMLGYAASLILLAGGVARVRRWARGPAVATQLLQLLVAVSFATGPTWQVALALGAVAVVTLGCLLAPSATAVFVPADTDA